jgi:hypothetical protein
VTSLWQAAKRLFKGFSVQVEWGNNEAGSCTRKVRYGHKETAERAVSAMMSKGSKPLEPYPCGYCAGWHIGGC